MVLLITIIVISLAVPFVGLLWMFWDMFFGNGKSLGDK